MVKDTENYMPGPGNVYVNENGERVVVFYNDMRDVRYAYERSSQEYTSTVTEFVAQFKPTDFINPEADSDTVTGDAEPVEPESRDEALKDKADESDITTVDGKQVDGPTA